MIWLWVSRKRILKKQKLIKDGEEQAKISNRPPKQCLATRYWPSSLRYKLVEYRSVFYAPSVKQIIWYFMNTAPAPPEADWSVKRLFVPHFYTQHALREDRCHSCRTRPHTFKHTICLWESLVDRYFLRLSILRMAPVRGISVDKYFQPQYFQI